jgi:hypothetical protein
VAQRRGRRSERRRLAGVSGAKPVAKPAAKPSAPVAPPAPRPRAPRRGAASAAKGGPPWRVIGLAAIIAIAAVATFVAIGTSSSDKRYTCDAIMPAPTGSVSSEGIEQPNRGNTHVSPTTTIDYALCPPTSGNHYNAPGAGPLRPGFYGPGDVARPGGWVHDLEHGYIVALYKGQPDEATIAALQRFVQVAPSSTGAQACGYPSKVIVARFDDMSTPFAVLAWDHILPLASWDQNAALSFFQRWVDVAGPEKNAC